MKKIAIVGAGSCGTALAIALGRSRNAHRLSLWVHGADVLAALRDQRENSVYLPGARLPGDVQITNDMGEALAGADIVVGAIPSAHARSVYSAMLPHLDMQTRAEALIFVSATKGIENGSLLRMTEVIAQEIPGSVSRVAAMSGPNLALEIARGLPAASVVGATDAAVSGRVLDILASRSFRLYWNADVIGVELCGALKNIVAIAAGAADRLGFGDNGKAGLMTRGLSEMTRLGVAAGANPLTFAGLAGIGDVMATCASPLSRNHRLGEELAEGRKWADIEGTLPGVAEGAYTVDAALAMAARLGVEMPIAREVHNALFEGKSVQRCLIDLLSRESKDELAGF